ncbi:MAG TPA: exodeoxyribonuclease VII large subunit [Novimethylophilus sp.]|uniref:exodeoxyribonuclease VII large subunit n=1 Tax=Novimethylophilus sp. TaxID=2137426 RepID=UPI002F405A25
MSDDLFHTQPTVLSVTELNRSVRELLEAGIPLLWVGGEISNLTRAASGHWYFSLKDARAQVRCVMFRSRNACLNWQPKEGDHVEARVLVSLYEARGEFQLTVEALRRAGLGALFEAFEKLKARLQQEGLFDFAKKRPLPAHPRQIGIVTSPDAAALRDVLTTLKRRMPHIPVVLYPTPVQGKGAAELIAKAIRAASERAECDVLIVCRGGGSLEDLWQFNEEIVARAIAACTMPVVSGIGHETDFSIADFAADVRAATPTAAAELVSQDRAILQQQIIQIRNRLARQMEYLLAERMQKLDYLSRCLVHPGERIRQQRELLGQLHARLGNAVQRRLHTAQAGLAPMPQRMHLAAAYDFERRQSGLQRLAQSLQHLSPQAVLERGYSLVQAADGTVVRSSRQIAAGDKLQLTFAQGSAGAAVVDTRN